MNFAPWPYFGDDEIQAAVNVLKSGKVNQWTGQEVSLFEEEFARYIGGRYAVALANGSVALDLALEALKIGQGDEIIVTPRSFVASVSCVALKGATPVFVDVDPVSQNITPENISAAITEKTKAVIAVNLSGWPCELDRIKQLCQQHGIFFIEDCAQAHGATLNGQKAGSFGDCAIFSFCQDKIMTTGGEGGMLVTNDAEIWENVWSCKDHGKNYKRAMQNHRRSEFRWLVDSLGSNYRMTEMQAAIGRVALSKLDHWVEKRNYFAGLYNEAFGDNPGLRTTTPDPEKIRHSYYKYYMFIVPEALKQDWSRIRIVHSLNQAEIPCSTGICPEIYLERVFTEYPCRIHNDSSTGKHSRLPVARVLGETSLMLMVHPTLDNDQIESVIDHVNRTMKSAIR